MRDILSSTAIAVLQNKLKEWKTKKIKVESMKENLKADKTFTTDSIADLAYNTLISQMQDFIDDLEDAMEQIENITAYQESCINLITKQIKEKNNDN